MSAIRTFVHDESGVAITEYGLILAGVVIVMIPALSTTGTTLVQQFTTTIDLLIKVRE